LQFQKIDHRSLEVAKLALRELKAQFIQNSTISMKRSLKKNKRVHRKPIVTRIVANTRSDRELISRYPSQSLMTLYRLV